MGLQRAQDKVRAWLLVATLLAGLAGYAFWANRHDPVLGWLAWAYLRQWGYGLCFLTAALATGWRLLRLILPAPPALGPRVSYALALGTLVFGLGVFVAGLVRLHPILFYAWPLVLLGLFGPGFMRDVRPIVRRLRRFGARLYTPPSWPQALAAGALLLALVAIYLLVMTPENIGWDARWYHLSIAEHYVAAGRIAAFPEGWYLGAYPQLATWLYTWAFLAPGSLFEHAICAAHLEWFLFLGTLPGIAVLVRRLTGRRVPFAAAALFLFPGIFLYDSSLIVGADHPLAFWAPPLALALLRLARGLDVRGAVLAGLILSGALLTKYQALYFLVPALALVAALTLRARRIGPALAGAATVLVATAPHWLKNLIFYGNPTYPLLSRWFPSRPFHPGAESYLDEIYLTPLFALRGTLPEKLGKTAAALVDFSFVPNNWQMFHGSRPVFGSLFTLLLPLLLVLTVRRRARPSYAPLWALIVACHIGIAVWYWTSHQDRFLQALLPWMAAAVGATLVAAWHELPRARVALAALVAFQVVWGGDVYFLRTHAMVGDSPLKPFADRVAGGFEGRGKERYRFGGRLAEIGRSLPPKAKVLIHDQNVRLGLGTVGVMDEIGWQGLFDYAELETPARAFAHWQRLGVTHAVWLPDRGDQNPRMLGREAVFARTLRLHQVAERSDGEFRVTEIARTPAPGAGTPTRIAWLGCGGDPPRGAYTPRGMQRVQPSEVWALEALNRDPAGHLARVNAIVLRASCSELGPVIAQVGARFDRAVSAGGVALWIERPGGAR